ncbi:hypothetical protein A3709_18510 [Halioglobus sp. HI00S01]|uniref:DUF5329 family protein n=1 Tax=Halioglobus sp. HI00S01 TaxID=1822214 RepID=UPI0007C30B66|nr:DUF5329 domain-containing protein [Halioglobus sp. HI00S01]KZX58514.1 hypothetical protein A3709_18510 [Halioglobus sp. HI00S01]
MKTLTTTAALLLALTATLVQADTPDPEVQYLLGFVEQSGCDFERNGTVHNSADAADHLRLKYRRGGKYVNNADQFIDRLASESSWTGKKYTVTCDGVTEPSGEWLHRALDEHRAQP